MRYRQARMEHLKQKESGNTSLFCNHSSGRCMEPPNFYCEQCKKRMCANHFISSNRLHEEGKELQHCRADLSYLSDNSYNEEAMCSECKRSSRNQSKKCCLCFNFCIALTILIAIVICFRFLIKEWRNDTPEIEWWIIYLLRGPTYGVKESSVEYRAFAKQSRSLKNQFAIAWNLIGYLTFQSLTFDWTFKLPYSLFEDIRSLNSLSLEECTVLRTLSLLRLCENHKIL